MISYNINLNRELEVQDSQITFSREFQEVSGDFRRFL